MGTLNEKDFQICSDTSASKKSSKLKIRTKEVCVYFGGGAL